MKELTEDDITLGKCYRDKLTGFEGIAVSSHGYLHGCLRVSLQPQKLHEGKLLDPQTFDVPQLEFVNNGIYSEKPEADVTMQPRRKEPGGPQNEPGPRAIPQR